MRKQRTGREIFLIAIMLFILGCLGSGEQSQISESLVRPMSEIIAAGPDFVDIGSNSATVLIDTSIPVVCAAVYGPTTDYGRIATDTDMAGGGHSEHHPLLRGLEPDTLYHVRFQGVGADGTLYRSRDNTFRTAVAEEVGNGRPDGVNLALIDSGGRVTNVSSNFGGGDVDSSFGATNAIDGDTSTEWSSDGDGDDAFIEIGLVQRTHVTDIGFFTRTMGSSAQISSFRIVTDEKEVHGPYELRGASGTEYFPVDFTAQRLRFEVVESSGGNTGAVEIEVYGEPVS